MISLVLVGDDARRSALLPLGDRTILEAWIDRLAHLDAPVASVVTTAPADPVTTVLGGRVPVAEGADLASMLLLTAESMVTADTELALVVGDLLVPDDALAELLMDPRMRTSALVGSAPLAVRNIRRQGERVVSAGSDNHLVGEPDGVFAGVLLIGRADLADAADAVRSMARVAQREGWFGDVADHVLVGLVRRPLEVFAHDLDPWPWWRPVSVEEVEQAQDVLSDVDARRVRLGRALRSDDGLYSTFVLRRVSRRLTPLALRRRLRPNQITLGSLVIGLVAALCFASGGRAGLVAGALLLQLSLVVDCVDGEVARYTRAFTPLGAWLDASTDRVKEYACYAGLALGANEDSVWLLAGAMLALQTTRHTTDYTFTLVQRVRERASGRAVLDVVQRDDGWAGSAGSLAGGNPPRRVPERSSERPWVTWTKKAIHLPIGERWLVISVVAGIGTPRLVFVTLLTLAVLALAYTSTARVLRARSWADLEAKDVERDLVRAQLDRGPLAAVLARRSPWELPTGRYAWMIPPALRLLEYAAVLGLVRVVAPDAFPAAFLFLFAVAYHHYDALYRVLKGLEPAGALHALGLGVEGRLILVLLLAAAGPDVLSAGLVALGVVAAALFGGIGTMGALLALRRDPGPLRREGSRA